MTFANFTLVPPPVAVLALLAAGALTAFLLAAAAVAGLAGRRDLSRRLGAASAALPTFYALLLLAFGAKTPARVVPRGAEKFFCEIDCHVGYSVVGIAEGPQGRARVVRVGVQVRFDETTTAPWRGNAPLTPNPRAAALVGSDGERFPADPAELPALSPPLRPGESRTVELAFLVPEAYRDLRLSLTESEGPVRLLLGHERAPLAGETVLALR